MPADVPTRESAAGIDLSPRFFRTATVVASPALAAETIIASVTVDGNLAVGTGCFLIAFAAWTVGTSGVSVTLKLRQTNVSGTTIRSTGAVTAVAGNLGCDTIIGFDTGPTLPNQIYVLTMQVASGAAASTVSAAAINVLVI